MAREIELEVYRSLRAVQDRHTYFLLAGAGTAIAFAITRSSDAEIAWTQIPLALAILAWAGSFFAGCRFISYAQNGMDFNIQLLQARGGIHPKVGKDPMHMAAASEAFAQRMNECTDIGAKWSKWQYYLLLIGAGFYIVWHVTEMLLRRFNLA